MRLSAVTVRISSAVFRSGDHAFGFVAATAEKRDHSSLTATWWSSIERPAFARTAFSNTG